MLNRSVYPTRLLLVVADHFAYHRHFEVLNCLLCLKAIAYPELLSEHELI